MPLPDALLEEFYNMQYSQHSAVWDRKATGKKLNELRLHNANLARYICKYSRLWKIHNFPVTDKDIPCPYGYTCTDCNNFSKNDGKPNVSTKILSTEKNLSTWSQNEICAMERGSNLTLEKVFYYAFLAQVPLSSILVLQDGYAFDSEGIIRKIKKEK